MLENFSYIFWNAKEITFSLRRITTNTFFQGRIRKIEQTFDFFFEHNLIFFLSYHYQEFQASVGFLLERRFGLLLRIVLGFISACNYITLGRPSALYIVADYNSTI
jgi:hypothetical protein